MCGVNVNANEYSQNIMKEQRAVITELVDIKIKESALQTVN